MPEPKIKILYTLPPNEPKSFETDRDCIIFGRKPRSDEYIDLDLQPDSYVSRIHARLSYEDGNYFLEDVNSANGSYVDEQLITEKTRLTSKSKIKIGWTIIEIQDMPPDDISESEPLMDGESTIVREVDAPSGDSEIEDIEDKTLFYNEEASPDSVSETAPEATIVSSDIAPESFTPDPGIAPEATIVPDSNIAQEATMVSDSSLKQDVTPAPEKTFDPNVTIIKEGYAPIIDDEAAPEGTITSVKDVLSPPFLSLEEKEVDGDTQKQLQDHLKILNNFVQALSKETTIEGLGEILVSELKKVIPQAQRGALLLPDSSGELLLKAHWPPGKHSVSITFVNRAFTRHEAFIWSAKKPEDTSAEDDPKSAVYYDVQSAIYLPLISAGEKLGLMYVDNYLDRKAFSKTDFELLRAISNHVAMYLNEHVLRKGLKKEEEVRSNLLRQYSPKIAEKILQKSSNLQRGGERVDPVTILVTDIRGFTALSAKMEPDDVVRALNEMFDAFVPIIYENEGIVDKYVGDSLLAVFGSPEKDSEQWEKAVKAGVKMQEAMRMLADGRKIRHLPAFEVGIGIHTGEVIHGFIGSSERIEFTVIGDTVNQAARFCDGANPNEVVISKEVFERVYHLVDVQPKNIVTKHPDKEPDLEGYVVHGLKGSDNQ